MVQGGLASFDVLPEKGWRRGLALENGNNTRLRRPFSFPITPPRRLKDGVQPRFLPEYGREVHIYPGFNEGGGDNPAGKALAQPPTNFFQYCLAVGGVHKGGQVKGTLTVQQMENFLGGLAPVDNAEDLRLGIEPLGKGAVVQLSFPAEGDTAENMLLVSMGWADLCRRLVRQKFPL